QKADIIANEINTELSVTNISGATSVEAAKLAEMIFVTVPYKAHHATIEQIKSESKGKIIVDVTVPLVPGNIEDQRDEVTSAAEDAVIALGEDVAYVSGFHTISHTVLNQLDTEIESDVF